MLNLAPGRNSLSVTGDMVMVTSIDVPAHAARVELHKRSTGLAVTGVILLGIATIDEAIVGANNSSNMTAAQAKSNLELALGGLALAIVGAICYFSAGSDGADVHGASAALQSGRRQFAFRGLDLKANQHGAAAVAGWTF